jgi:hypothetical protein
LALHVQEPGIAILVTSLLVLIILVEINPSFELVYLNLSVLKLKKKLDLNWIFKQWLKEI